MAKVDPDTIEADEERERLHKERRARNNRKHYAKNRDRLLEKAKKNKAARRKKDGDHERRLEEARRIRIKSTWEGHTSWLLRTARHRANRKGIPCQITEQWILAQLEQQNYRCCMSGVQLDLQPARAYYPFQPSLDRIDNSKGYTYKNTRIVCLMFNLARNNASDVEIVDFARQLVAYNDQNS